MRLAAASLSDLDDWQWSMTVLLGLLEHRDVWVAGSAAMGLADLVRLEYPVPVSELKAALEDAAAKRDELKGRIETALDDIAHFQSLAATTEPAKASSADELMAQLKAKRDAQTAANLAAAKDKQHAAGKEPFDLAALEKIYDTTTETGVLPSTEQRQRKYEESYYLLNPQVMTITAFAAVLSKNAVWRN